MTLQRAKRELCWEQNGNLLGSRHFCGKDDANAAEGEFSKVRFS